MFGAGEFDFWKRGENVREARKFNRELFVKICVPLADRSTFIKPGDEVVPGITAVDAAGHSPGLLAFHIESNDKRIMVTADTCTQYVMAVQRPEWHFEMDDDKDKAVAGGRQIVCRKLSYAISRCWLYRKRAGRLSLGAAQLSAQSLSQSVSRWGLFAPGERRGSFLFRLGLVFIASADAIFDRLCRLVVEDHEVA